MKLIDKHPQNESETDKKNSYSSLILITNWKSCCVKKHFLQTKCIEKYCPATPWALRSTLNCVSWKLPIRMLPASSLYLTEAERNEKDERTVLCLINQYLLKQDQTILQKSTGMEFRHCFANVSWWSERILFRHGGVWKGFRVSAKAHLRKFAGKCWHWMDEMKEDNVLWLS